MSKKKNNTPKRKRLNRKARLLPGRKWLEAYNGKHLVKGYSKWFGVDKLCAIAELRMLGVQISDEYEEQVKRAMEDLAKARRRKKELSKEQHHENDLWSDETFAYIAGYTANGVPFGTTHEEMEEVDEEFDERASIFNYSEPSEDPTNNGHDNLN